MSVIEGSKFVLLNLSTEEVLAGGDTIKECEDCLDDDCYSSDDIEAEGIVIVQVVQIAVAGAVTWKKAES